MDTLSSNITAAARSCIFSLFRASETAAINFGRSPSIDIPLGILDTRFVTSEPVWAAASKRDPKRAPIALFWFSPEIRPEGVVQCSINLSHNRSECLMLRSAYATARCKFFAPRRYRCRISFESSMEPLPKFSMTKANSRANTGLAAFPPRIFSSNSLTSPA